MQTLCLSRNVQQIQADSLLGGFQLLSSCSTRTTGVEPSIRPPVFKTLRQRPVSGKHCETGTRLARPVRDSSTRVTAVLIWAVHDMVISPIINHEYSTVYSGVCAVYVINMHSGDHQLVTAHHLHHITITRKTTCT